MIAHVSIKPTTDVYAGVSGAALFAVELPLVRVTTPGADADPNVAPLLPTDPRVLAWPDYGYIVTGAATASILGGTNLTGRFWIYDTASTKWLPIGGLIVLTTGAAQGTFVSAPRSKKLYWQTTAQTGNPTDLFYGLI